MGHEATERGAVSGGYILAKDEPNADEILEALREAVFEKPRITEMPSEAVARQLVLGGHLQEEPSTVLVADMLDALEAEESTFNATSSPRKITLREYG